MPVREKRVKSVDEFIKTVRRDRLKWATSCPWFRGEPGNTNTPLVPGVFRSRPGGGAYDENHLLQQFRMKGPSFIPDPVPQRGEIDLWLFLAQHHGLPTRLLDWTEGSLIALYFALLEDRPRRKKPIVWMLNPTELNRKRIVSVDVKEHKKREYVLAFAECGNRSQAAEVGGAPRGPWSVGRGQPRPRSRPTTVAVPGGTPAESHEPGHPDQHAAPFGTREPPRRTSETCVPLVNRRMPTGMSGGVGGGEP
jgi:hypothetical protein